MTETTAATRVVDGATVPLAGDWIVDPLHTSLAFEARHFVVTRMRGRFRHGTGVIHIAEVPEESSVEITIDAASIDTIHPKADEHLRGEHFLDVERFPTITFRSSAVRHVAGTGWAITGAKSSAIPTSTARSDNVRTQWPQRLATASPDN